MYPRPQSDTSNYTDYSDETVDVVNTREPMDLTMHRSRNHYREARSRQRSSSVPIYYPRDIHSTERFCLVPVCNLGSRSPNTSNNLISWPPTRLMDTASRQNYLTWQMPELQPAPTPQLPYYNHDLGASQGVQDNPLRYQRISYFEWASQMFQPRHMFEVPESPRERTRSRNIYNSDVGPLNTNRIHGHYLRQRYGRYNPYDDQNPVRSEQTSNAHNVNNFHYNQFHDPTQERMLNQVSTAQRLQQLQSYPPLYITSQPLLNQSQILPAQPEPQILPLQAQSFSSRPQLSQAQIHIDTNNSSHSTRHVSESIAEIPQIYYLDPPDSVFQNNPMSDESYNSEQSDIANAFPQLAMTEPTLIVPSTSVVARATCSCPCFSHICPKTGTNSGQHGTIYRCNTVHDEFMRDLQRNFNIQPVIDNAVASGSQSNTGQAGPVFTQSFMPHNPQGTSERHASNIYNPSTSSIFYQPLPTNMSGPPFDPGSSFIITQPNFVHVEGNSQSSGESSETTTPVEDLQK